MHFTATSLIAGMILSSIGAGFFTYGKRAGRPVYLACGAILAIFSWFLSSVVALVVFGIVLMVIPFVASWWFAI